MLIVDCEKDTKSKIGGGAVRDSGLSRVTSSLPFQHLSFLRGIVQRDASNNLVNN